MNSAKNWKVESSSADNLIEQLLANRGIKTDLQKRIYLNPSLDDFLKEVNITNIKKARARIKQAIQKDELIFIFGDYDVDGITACAVLYHGLTSLGARVLPYIPHREKEGYGLSKTGLDIAKKKNARLVITVDCGIVAIGAAKYAKELGLDLIITDHHQPLDSARGHDPRLPDAYTIVHSTKMCGAAVAWCLIRDLISQELSDDLIQLVAIATVCDMIPLVGVNRYFVKQGLEVLRRTKNIGLKALFLESGITAENIGTFELSYMIGPRLNAIGRLEHALDALRLLCTKDPQKARQLAQLLCQANEQRKQLTTSAIEEARMMLSQPLTSKLLVLSSKTWLPGIIGLIAGKISEEYQVAVIAISEGPEVSKGSARSANGLNIVETLRTCSELLLDVGGHEGAAGFSLESEKLGKFKDKIFAIDLSKLEIAEKTLMIDAVMPLTKINGNLIEQLKEFEPFGLGNPSVILASEKVRVDEVRTVGDGKHLKLVLEGVGAIGFGMGNLASLLSKGQLIDIAYTPEIDNFNGTHSISLKLKDIRFN